MTPKKPKSDPGKYEVYAQYAFRASREEIDEIQSQMADLHEKFNKERDPSKPRGRKAVKVGTIALEALKVGIKVLQKRDKWDFKKK